MTPLTIEPQPKSGFEGWQDIVLHFDVSTTPSFDKDALMSEALAVLGMDGLGAQTQEQDCRADNTPGLIALRDSIILPLVRQYVRRIWEAPEEIEELDTWSWAVAYRDGRGLELHNHPMSHLTSVLYLEFGCETGSELVLLDPRGHAGRFYPKAIRDRNFAPHRIRPKSGTLLIFPSYIQHYVAAGSEGLRMSFNSDHVLTMEAPE